METGGFNSFVHWLFETDIQVKLKMRDNKKEMKIRDLQMKDYDLKLIKEKNSQISNMEYFLILNLQEGFAGVATLEVQKELHKNGNKNFVRRGEHEKSDVRTFSEERKIV